MIHIYRLANALYRLRIPFLPWMLKILNRILFSVVLPPSVHVGRGVVFGYQGLGIVVHRHAVIGNNVTIAPNVVIGGRGRPGAPVIGDNVLIGAGACVLGPVSIGEGAKIGANTVVIVDVPPFATVVGATMRVIEA
jgi:serine O-acetyltransferase